MNIQLITPPSLLFATAKQFHLIQIAQDILLDPAKRAYLNSKADEDRRRKEKMAGMEKRRRGMVDVSRDIAVAAATS